MTTKNRPLFCVSLLLLCAALGATEPIIVNGPVVDRLGQPVAGARIQAVPINLPAEGEGEGEDPPDTDSRFKPSSAPGGTDATRKRAGR